MNKMMVIACLQVWAACEAAHNATPLWKDFVDSKKSEKIPVCAAKKELYDTSKC